MASRPSQTSALRPPPRWGAGGLLALLLLAAAWPPARGAFTFNFAPRPDGAGGDRYARCNFPGYGNDCYRGNPYNNNNDGNGDSSGFLQEITSEGGVNYYHVIVLDDPNGFRQETYIREGWGSYQGGPGSYSTGNNRYDGFSPTSGDGTGDARRVVMKQTLSGGGVSQTFLKASLGAKPVISQTLTDGPVSASFQFDMSNSGYGTAAVAGTLTSTLTLADPALGGAADFDHAAQAQASTLTGGRYTYSGGVSGSYSYFDGAFPHKGVDWCPYRDPAQNVGHKSSPC